MLNVLWLKERAKMLNRFDVEIESLIEAGALSEAPWDDCKSNKETKLCPIHELDEIPTPYDMLRTAIAEKFPHIPLDKPDFTKRKEIELEDLDVQVTTGTIFDQAVKQMVSPGISMEYIPSINDTKYLADDAEFTKEMYDMFKDDNRERLADIEARNKMDNGESADMLKLKSMGWDVGATGKYDDMEPTPEETDHTRHEDITTELYMIFDEKDSKYGKSFEQSVKEFGLVSAVIRMSDKMNRLKNIVMDEINMDDNDESTRDTLLDLANYAILSVMQLDKWNEE